MQVETPVAPGCCSMAPKHAENLNVLDFEACKVPFGWQCADIRGLLFNQERWELHPSTVDNPLALGNGG